MTGPGDQAQAAAAGRGRLRASRADREQVIDTLKAAFVQDRMNKDEFDERVGQALAARTYAELAALTGDIPAGLAAALPRGPGQGMARLRESKTAKVAVYATMVAGLVMISAIGDTRNPLLVLGTVVLLSPCWLLALAGLLLLHSRLEKRAMRQVPPGPGQDGPGLDDQRHAGAGDDPALSGDQAGRRAPGCARTSPGRTGRTLPGAGSSPCAVSRRRAA